MTISERQCKDLEEFQPRLNRTPGAPSNARRGLLAAAFILVQA